MTIPHRPLSWPLRWLFTQSRSRLALVTAGRLLAVLAVAVTCLLMSPAAQAVAATSGTLIPPLPPPFTVLHPFSLPNEPWLAGNRGVDLSATTGEPVLAAAAGIVVYSGMLAGRGVISISHGAIRTTYEPVAPIVSAGAFVSQGEVIGHLSGAADACGPPGSCLHWGAITAGGYVDPLGLVGPPRIRLLPIWGADVPPPASSPTASSAPPPARVSGWRLGPFESVMRWP
ncbi:MAG: M23 family metallopeptidase [Acidothermaceae bacterium]